MFNQSCRQTKAFAVCYKFGVKIPRTAKEAYKLDITTEISQLNDYNTFEDLNKGTRTPPGYTSIYCHLVFDFKEDGHCKAQFVAGGHLTAPPKDSIYSSVASLHSICIVAFLIKLNGLELSAANVGNAYLEAQNKKLVAFKAGPESGLL